MSDAGCLMPLAKIMLFYSCSFGHSQAPVLHFCYSSYRIPLNLSTSKLIPTGCRLQVPSSNPTSNIIGFSKFRHQARVLRHTLSINSITCAYVRRSFLVILNHSRLLCGRLHQNYSVPNTRLSFFKVFNILLIFIAVAVEVSIIWLRTRCFVVFVDCS
jgi:hypothetical protein